MTTLFALAADCASSDPIDRIICLVQQINAQPVIDALNRVLASLP